MPATVTVLEATAEANHHIAVQKANIVWKKESEKMIPESGYLSAKAFDEKATQILEKSLSTFNGTKRMLSAKYGNQYRENLEQDILSKIDVMRKLNDEKRAAKQFQTPLILLFTIIVALFASSISGLIKVLIEVLIESFKTFRIVRPVSSGLFDQVGVNVSATLSRELGRRLLPRRSQSSAAGKSGFID